MQETADDQILYLLRNKHTAEEGFLLLVKKYQQRLYWHIRRMLHDHNDTDDVLQETFINVWKGIGNFREDSQLFTWLFRIATNETLSFLRKRHKSKQLLSSALNDKSQGHLSGETPYSGDEISIRLQEAIHALPHKQKLVFNMKYFDGMKYEEMADILGTSVAALKASYHHAVKKIEQQLIRG